MTRREIEKLIRDSFDVIVEPRRNGNKFWIRHSEECGLVHYPITAVQFDWLLEGGYISPDYRVERNVGLWGADVLVYRGR